jgi:archaeal flagellar protein FlaI
MAEATPVNQRLQRALLSALRGQLHSYQAPEQQLEIVERAIAAETGAGELGAAARRQLAEDFLKLDLVEEFVLDPGIEDIMINGVGPIHIYHAAHGMRPTTVRFRRPDELDAFVEKLLVLSGKSLTPILDLHLPRNLRANIVRSPLGFHITIRRLKAIPPSIIDLVEWQVLDFTLAAELWMYADGLRVRPANMLFGGAPGAGKTTLLNAMFSFFAAHERVVTIEETFELNTATVENCARLEIGGELSAQDLVKNALRMRPDRLIVGELRGGEAEQLITAINLGACALGTIHTDTARNIVRRLQNRPMNVPVDMLALIDVMIVIRALHDGTRLHRAIVEVAENAGIEGDTVLLSEPQRYDVTARRMIEPMNARTFFRDRVARAAGVTPRQVMDEVRRRERILQALRDHQVRSLPHVSQFVRDYYTTPARALGQIGLAHEAASIQSLAG